MIGTRRPLPPLHRSASVLGARHREELAAGRARARAVSLVLLHLCGGALAVATVAWWQFRGLDQAEPHLAALVLTRPAEEEPREDGTTRFAAGCADAGWAAGVCDVSRVLGAGPLVAECEEFVRLYRVCGGVIREAWESEREHGAGEPMAGDRSQPHRERQSIARRP